MFLVDRLDIQRDEAEQVPACLNLPGILTAPHSPHLAYQHDLFPFHVALDFNELDRGDGGSHCCLYGFFLAAICRVV